MPSLKFSIDYAYFSPDGDGIKEDLPVKITDSTSEKLWTAEIRNSRDKAVKVFTWKGVKNDFVWDGTDESGNPAEIGKYSIVIFATDDAGNSLSSEINNITLDSREIRVYLTSEYEGISPNNDGYLDVQTFDISATVAEDILSWNFAVLGADNNPVFALSFDTYELPV